MFDLTLFFLESDREWTGDLKEAELCLLLTLLLLFLLDLTGDDDDDLKEALLELDLESDLEDEGLSRETLLDLRESCGPSGMSGLCFEDCVALVASVS